MKTNLFQTIILAVLLQVAAGCSTHGKQIFVGALVGGAVGAGLGYTVIHHGMNNKYEVPNTLITSGVVALLTAGALAYHYNALDEEKVKVTSEFSRKWVLENENARSSNNMGEEFHADSTSIGKYSLQLDDETRWVYPTFRKRFLKPEASGNELLSSRYSWEIVKPGFFITKAQQPWYFSSEIQPSDPSSLKPSSTKETLP